MEAVVNQCVNMGESNSVLVIGPRGSGKSKVVFKYYNLKMHNLIINLLPSTIKILKHFRKTGLLLETDYYFKNLCMIYSELKPTSLKLRKPYNQKRVHS